MNAQYLIREITSLGALAQEEYSQLRLISLEDRSKPTGEKMRRRQVQRTLEQIRKLRDELNSALYTHPTERPAIHSPLDGFNILQPFMIALDQEELWTLNLDTRNRVMSVVQIYKGSVNMSQVRISEIFRQAIIDNSPAIVISHNHPSGDPTPSPDDVAITRGIVQAGKLLDISVLDHLVLGGGRYISLKERGLGFE